MSSLLDRNERLGVVTEEPPALPQTDQLISAITDDAGTLINQHVTLFQAEMREGLDRAKWCMLGVMIGVGCLTMGVLFVMMAVVRGLLERYPGLSEWASWLIVGSSLLILGGAAVGIGMYYIVRVTLIPTRTLKTLAESWSWLTTRQK